MSIINPEEYLETLTKDIISLELKLSTYEKAMAAIKEEADSRLRESLSMTYRDPQFSQTCRRDENLIVQRLLMDAKVFHEKFREKQLTIDMQAHTLLRLENHICQNESEKINLKNCIFRLSEQLTLLKADLRESDVCKTGGNMEYVQCDSVCIDISPALDSQPSNTIIDAEYIGVMGKPIPHKRISTTRRDLRPPPTRISAAHCTNNVRNYNIRDD